MSSTNSQKSSSYRSRSAWMRWGARLVMRRPGLLTVLGILLILWGGYYTAQLYSNLKPEFEELLPTRARSVVDAKKVQNRIASSDYLAILLFFPDFEKGKAGVEALAARLQKEPASEIAYVEYRIDQALDFFDRRRALFISVDDLSGIRNYIQDRIQYEKDIAFSLFGDVGWEAPKFDFDGLRKKYQSQANGFTHYPDAYYARPEENVFAVLVGIPNEKKTIDGSYRFRSIVEKAISDVDLTSHGLESIRFTGGVQDVLEEHSSLIADLALITGIVLLLTIGIMILFYRSVLGVFAITVALVIGSLVTCGVTYFIFGYVNMNSAFMSSIIIGNGVNYGIIYLARYIEELRRGRGHVRATFISFDTTPKATLTASLAAGIAYGSLMVTDFRGFQQFGVMGFIGMVLCWLASYAFLPSLLTLLRRWVTAIRPMPSKRFFVVNWVRSQPKVILTSSVLFSVLSIFFLIRMSGGFIETDLTKMRDKHSLESGSGFYSSYLHRIFRAYPHPLGVAVNSDEDALKVSAALKEDLKRPESNLGRVVALEDFVPFEQLEKVSILKDIQRLLSAPILKWGGQGQQNARKEIDSFLTPESLRPFSEMDLPDLVKRKLSERDGAMGRLILVEPKIGKTENLEDLSRFVRELRATVDGVAQDVAVAGQLSVSSDLVEEIRVEGPKTTLIAFFAVVVLVIVLFREVRISLLILSSLLFGVLWLLGGMAAFDMKVNFLNFIVLPITFGIAVDYGVNILERYRHEGRGGILPALNFTGSAVLLASLTTIIGYGGLIIAGNQAIASFGLLAVVGELTCLITAMLSIPAYLHLKDPKTFS